MKDLSDIVAKRQRDFDDLQHEISGVDVGRIRRFLSPEDDRTPEGKRKKRELERIRQRLSDLMLDPAYARMHRQLAERLSRAETEADGALELLRGRLEQVSEAISSIEDLAARGPDGKIVFQQADGQVVYSDGSKVPDDIAAGVIWPPNAPSAEEYFALKSRQLETEAQLNAWDSYRMEVLGPIRDRMDDEDKPFETTDDLRDALEQIEELRPSMASVETRSPKEAVLSSKPQTFPEFN